MRVLIVAESFLPETNGVAGSVLRILHHLQLRGVHATVVAAGQGAPDLVHGARVVRLPSVGLPRYPGIRVCLTGRRRMVEILRSHRPDVVYLASPMLLGGTAAAAARELGLPVVASFQTDVAGFAEHYGVGLAARRVWARLLEIHGRADRTLVPSAFTARMLAAQGIPRLHRWGRGVDHEQFRPSRRSTSWRDGIAAPGTVLVGYAGRLAAEKRVDELQQVADLPGTALVLIGAGPDRKRLESLLPTAHFTGHLTGDGLATAVAGLDVLVHPGRNETFCQGVQEALASGVPAVVPDAGAVPELIRPGRTGEVFDVTVPGSLRRAVLRLVSDPLHRSNCAAAAAASVADRSWAGVGDELLGHLEAVRGRRTSRAA